MLSVALTEAYDRRTHGHTSSTSSNIRGRRLVLHLVEPPEFAADPSGMLALLAALKNSRTNSPTEPKLELVGVERLLGNEDVSINRPCIISKVQRLWRKKSQLERGF